MAEPEPQRIVFVGFEGVQTIDQRDVFNLWIPQDFSRRCGSGRGKLCSSWCARAMYPGLLGPVRTSVNPDRMWAYAARAAASVLFADRDRPKLFGSESRKTFFHADATCLGSDPLVYVRP